MPQAQPTHPCAQPMPAAYAGLEKAPSTHAPEGTDPSRCRRHLAWPTAPTAGAAEVPLRDIPPRRNTEAHGQRAGIPKASPCPTAAINPAVRTPIYSALCSPVGVRLDYGWIPRGSWNPLDFPSVFSSFQAGRPLQRPSVRLSLRHALHAASSRGTTALKICQNQDICLNLPQRASRWTRVNVRPWLNLAEVSYGAQGSN